jgi:catechol 2,3-dioxygenase-like lactoylglutathione lyase family enzyme
MLIQIQRRICTIYSMLRSLVIALACATALSGQPLPLEGIAHVGYRVGDLDKADAYYSGVLGLARAFRTNDGAAFYKVSDDQYAEIAAGQSPSPPFHIALQTADIEAVRRLLRVRGIAAPRATKDPAGDLAFTLTAPEGTPSISWSTGMGRSKDITGS